MDSSQRAPLDSPPSPRHEAWTEIIEPRSNPFDLRLGEVWQYRDLLYMFVKRDFVAQYKQTILGPLWFFIQPLLTTLVFTVVFGRLANISTDGVPHILFYLAGLTVWGYFAECLNKTATVFRDNQGVFGKVYFPRLITPLSIVVSGLIKFAIQFGLFLFVYAYYLFFTETSLAPNSIMLLSPLLVVLMAGLALGFGMIISGLTTKYRDFVFLLAFGTQLFMYATPIIYPLSSVPLDKQYLLILNPMTAIIETFKYGFLGHATFAWPHLLYSCGFTLAILFLGVLVFNRTEQNFIDTV